MSTRVRLEQQVFAAVDAATRDVMRWGTDDCALWCANVVRDALGYDPAASFRGRYKTRRGALRVLGRGGLLAALRRTARRHRWKRIDPALAQPGDVGLAWTRLPDGKAVLATVICRAEKWFVGRNERGFSAIPAKDVVIAWSVLDDARKPESGKRHAMNRSIPRLAGIAEPAAVADPISDAIGLSALLSGVLGGAAVGGIASAVGGFIIASGVSPGLIKESVL